MAALAAALPGIAVESTAAHGIDPDFVEAMAFAWLARETLAGRPGNRRQRHRRAGCARARRGLLGLTTPSPICPQARRVRGARGR